MPWQMDRFRPGELAKLVTELEDRRRREELAAQQEEVERRAGIGD